MTLPTAADKSEIIDLSSRYALAMDEHRVDAWLATWCVDGRWEGPLGIYSGHAQLPNLLRDLGERNEGRRHCLSNHVIEFANASEAIQTCYMQIVAYRGGCRIVGTGVYRDRLLKSAGGQWRFAERILTLDS